MLRMFLLGKGSAKPKVKFQKAIIKRFNTTI